MLESVHGHFINAPASDSIKRRRFTGIPSPVKKMPRSGSTSLVWRDVIGAAAPWSVVRFM
jgi:hypothetical protein